MHRRAALTVVVPGLLLAASVSAAPVSSNFDSGPGGWSVIDVEGAGNYASIFGTYAGFWNASGGNPAGYFSTNDPTNGAVFFRAPAAYLGDKSTYVGETLSFDLKTTHDTWGGDNAVVLVGDGGQIVATSIPQPAVDVWQSFAVSLSAGSFRQNNLLGAPVSDAVFGAILADLEEVYIPAEFASGLIEISALDNVHLTPEPGAAIALALAATAGLRRRS